MKPHIFKVISLAVLFLQFENNSAQNSTYQIKEQYDKHQKTFIENGSYNPCDIGNDYVAISNVYGDGMSYVLESYIRMYETTKDKAYLIKFILNAICMHEHRRDKLGIDTDPTWACKTCCDNTPYDGVGPPCMYHDGNIIWAMSHFVYLIKVQEPSLNTLPLPQIAGTKIPSNDFGINLWNTYGDFAEWIRIRTEQTLDYYTYGSNAYWADDTRCYTPIPNPDTDPDKTFAQAVNQQAGFACALFYLGITDPNTDYLHKAAQIAKAYKGTVDDQSNCYQLFGDWYGVGYNDTRDVTELQSNNSYVWKSNGWRRETCAGAHGNSPDDYEDISHAVQTLIYPQAINNRLQSNGVMLFDDNDMIRYRNTFSYNIFAGYSSSCPQFHSGVDGDDVITYNSSLGGLNTLKIRALAWMPFYKYDGYSSVPDVYNIVMDYYACDVLNNISNVASGMDYYGLSEVISAQWNKECNDITLYNRKVNYDQDFFAKGTLTIAPKQNDNFHQQGDPSFAEPIITQDEFTVEPGTSVTMVAGKSIVLKPGTHIKAGSNFHAYIDPTLCTDEKRLSFSNGNNDNKQNISNVNNSIILNDTLTQTYNDVQPQEIEKQLQEINEFNYEYSFTVAPNPFSEETTISFSIKEKCSVTLKVINQYGITVYNEIENVQTDQGYYNVPFDGKHLSKGIYFCILQLNGQIFQIQKIILIN